MITISNIESSCVAGAGGTSGSSPVGTINGQPIGGGSGSISIPLVAAVFYNQTVTTRNHSAQRGRGTGTARPLASPLVCGSKKWIVEMIEREVG